MPRVSAHTEQHAAFEICHRIPGRVRLRIPALREDKTLGPRLASALRALEGVQATRINPACASLVLYHRPAHRFTPDLLAQALQPWLPAPGAARSQPNPGSRLSKPVAHPARRAPQPAARPAVRPSRAPCILCQMKLNAARWILADVWRCWRRAATQRMRAALTAPLPLPRA